MTYLIACCSTASCAHYSYPLSALIKPASSLPPTLHPILDLLSSNMTTQMGTTLQQFSPAVAEDDNMDIDIDIDMDADVEPIPEPELEVMISRLSHHNCAPLSQLCHRKGKNTRRRRSMHPFLLLLSQLSILKIQNKRFNRPRFTSEASTTSPPMMFGTS